MRATLASVSTLLTSVGGAGRVVGPAISTPAGEPSRRRRPRRRRGGTAGRSAGTAAGRRCTSSSAGLLAVQVLVGPGEDRRSATPSAQPGRRDLGDRARAAPRSRRRTIALTATIDPVGADRVGGDERALEDAVRVARAGCVAVLERARLALGAVDDDRGRQRRPTRCRRRCATSCRSGSRRRPGPAGRRPRARSIVAARPELAAAVEAVAARRRRCRRRASSTGSGSSTR